MLPTPIVKIAIPRIRGCHHGGHGGRRGIVFAITDQDHGLTGRSVTGGASGWRQCKRRMLAAGADMASPH
jgi:hypothetical protein